MDGNVDEAMGEPWSTGDRECKACRTERSGSNNQRCGKIAAEVGGVAARIAVAIGIYGEDFQIDGLALSHRRNHLDGDLQHDGILIHKGGIRHIACLQDIGGGEIDALGAIGGNGDGDRLSQLPA